MFQTLLFVLLGLATASHAARRPFGPRFGLDLPVPRPRCSSEPIVITVMSCRLDHDKNCSTEPKVVGDRVTYEKGECKEVEVCKPPAYFVPRSDVYKREADPQFLDDLLPECEKETKEVCKQVPVKTPVEKIVEKCVLTPREVCEEREKEVAQITCEAIKLDDDYDDDDEDDEFVKDDDDASDDEDEELDLEIFSRAEGRRGKSSQ